MPATIQPARLRTLIRLVWQAGTVAWIGGGVLLIAAPSLGSESARHWIVVTIVAVFAFAAAANAWWSRGRGFGWKALGAVVVLRWRGTKRQEWSRSDETVTPEPLPSPEWG